MKTKNYWTKNKFTGEKEGPFSFKEIATLIWRGDLNRYDFVKTSDADQWVKAESLLEEVFIKVEARKKSESENRGLDSVTPAGGDKSSAKGKMDGVEFQKIRGVNSIHRRQPRRITFLGLVFGSFKASPYAGFWLMKLLINIFIVLHLILIVVITLGFVVGLVAESLSQGQQENEIVNRLEDDFATDLQQKSPFVQSLLESNSSELSKGRFANSSSLSLLPLVLGIVFFWLFQIVVLIFFRNIIDWLIDMEDHANAIRRQTIN